jgi:P-type conjugative transfer protein TrbG
MKKSYLISIIIFCLVVFGSVAAKSGLDKGNSKIETEFGESFTSENAKNVNKPGNSAKVDANNGDNARDSRKIKKNPAGNNQGMYKSAIVKIHTVYTYRKNTIYQIFCKELRLTDIQLQNGETVLFVGAGDTASWQVDKDISGSGDSQQTHIYLKPLRTGTSTDLIINTDRHSYHCEVIAGNRFSPIISWEYPNEKKTPNSLLQQAEQNEMGFESGDVFISYRISGTTYPWKPKLAFSDKTHVYIKMPEEMKSYEAPVIYIKDGRKLQIVNYRIRNNYYIVDRLFEKAELRCGNKKVYLKRTGKQIEKAELKY